MLEKAASRGSKSYVTRYIQAYGNLNVRNLVEPQESLVLIRFPGRPPFFTWYSKPPSKI